MNVWGLNTEEKVTKINLDIISKAHTHLQTVEKTYAKFQKDMYKIVWGYHKKLSINLGSENDKVHNVEKKTKIMQGLYQKHMYIFRENVQSFKKIGTKLYEELCSQGTHCVYIKAEKWPSSQCRKKWQK